MYKLQEKVFKMKTSTTTHLQLDKLDRVALEHLREALPYYTRLTDIAVNGTPLTNQDAIVQVVRAHIFCRDGWCFQFPFLGFQVAHLLHLFLIAVSSSGCNFPCLGKQWILCSVEVLYFKTRDATSRRLLSFCVAATAVVVVVLVVSNPTEERGCNCAASKWSHRYTNGELWTA